MATITVGGVQLAYEEAGAGPPVVLVHGSWADRRAWAAVSGPLAEEHRVIAYDRRGHTESERPPGRARIADHVSDLAGLIEGLASSPAHVVTSSFGGEIGLRLTLGRPDLVVSLSLHEPPLYDLLADDPEGAVLLRDLRARMAPVLADIERGDDDTAARQFVETIAMGPGMWEALPAPVQQTFVRNAPTWLGDVGDPTQGSVDPAALGALTTPVLLTDGARSVPDAAIVTRRLAELLPQARRHTFPEAGHVPHRTHPDELVEVLRGFLRDVEASPTSGR